MVILLSNQDLYLSYQAEREKGPVNNIADNLSLNCKLTLELLKLSAG